MITMHVLKESSFGPGLHVLLLQVQPELQTMTQGIQSGL